MYYAINSKLTQGENVRQVSLEFAAKSDSYITSLPVVLGANEQIARVLVRYEGSDEYRVAELSSIQTLPRTPEELSDYQSQNNPAYVLTESGIDIFPKPEVTIADGVMVFIMRPYLAIGDLEGKTLDDKLNENVVGIPGQHQRAMIPGIQWRAMERARYSKSDIDGKKLDFELEKNKIIKQIAGRGGKIISRNNPLTGYNGDKDYNEIW